jgi:hypothetical protein
MIDFGTSKLPSSTRPAVTWIGSRAVDSSRGASSAWTSVANKLSNRPPSVRFIAMDPEDGAHIHTFLTSPRAAGGP